MNYMLHRPEHFALVRRLDIGGVAYALRAMVMEKGRNQRPLVSELFLGLRAPSFGFCFAPYVTNIGRA